MPKQPKQTPQEEYRKRMDRRLESAGLLNYQTQGMSQVDIAARYKEAGIGVNDKWFEQNYGDRPAGAAPQAQQSQGMQFPAYWNMTRLSGDGAQGPTFDLTMWKQARSQALGYDPTFGQDPKAVADAYKVLKATPKDMALPSWMIGQEAQIEQAYKWYAWRNGNKPDSEWGYLPADDPGHQWLTGLHGPVDETAAPTFSNNNQVQQGAAAWEDMAPEQRAQILKNPNFDITQYPVASRDQILNDPAFDWSRLPKWQKTYYEIMSNPKIMASPMALAGAHAGGLFGMPGKIAGAVIGYNLGLIGGQEYDPTSGIMDQPTTVAGLMAVLNKMSEGAEQGIGYSAQVINAAGAGIQGNDEAADTAKKMLFDKATREAAMEAGRVTYEISDFMGARNWVPSIAMLMALSDTRGINPLNKADREKVMKANNITFADKGQDFVIGSAAPVERTKYEAINPATGEAFMTNDPLAVLRQARRTIHDAIIKGEDPRVVVRELLSEQGQYVGSQVADFAGQAVIDPLEMLPEVTSKTTSKLAKLLGNETAARAFGEANAPVEGIRRWGSLVQTGDVPVGFDYGKLNSVQRWIAGINDGATPTHRAGPFTKTGLLDKPTEIKNTWQRIKEDWAALTPESRAREGASMFYNNIGALLSTMDDPHEAAKFIKSLSGSDMQLWKEMGGKIANSPEWYTILPALKAFNADALDGLIRSWDLAEPKRTRLMQIADALGEDPGKWIEDVAKRGTPEQDFARLQERLKQTPNGAEMLRQIEAGMFKAADLQDIVNAFTGDASLHWHPDQFKASLLDALGKHFDEWTVNQLGLGDDPAAKSAFFRVSHLLKSAQSVLLLGGSPSYALQNGLSNMVHRAATGIYGYMTPGQIDTWLKRFGVEPARMNEGVGIGGETGMAPNRTNVQTAKIDAALRKPGRLGVAQKLISSIGSAMPFQKLSGWFESVEGRNGYMIAMRDMWNKTWRRGVGFEKMTPQLEAHLQRAGISPEHIYRLIEAGMNNAEIERYVYSRQTGIMTRTLVDDAAKAVGINGTDAATMLDKIGVLDKLDQLMEKALTPDQVRQAFKSAADHAQDYQDMQTAADLKAMAEDVTNKVGIEGPKAALDVVQRVNGNYFDAWMDHYYRFEDIMTDIHGIDDPRLKRAAIEEAYEISSREFRRINGRTAALYKGIFEAWKQDTHPQASIMLAAIADNDALMSDAYTYMREQRRQFFNSTDTKKISTPESRKAWDEVQAMIDKRFQEAFAAKAVNEAKMGDAMMTLYAETYGLAAAEAGAQWWEKVNKFSNEIVKREQRFRKSLKKMTGAERAVAKYKYYSTDKIALIAELERINQEGIARLERVIGQEKRRAPAPATAEGVVDNLREDYSQNIKPKTDIEIGDEENARLEFEYRQREEVKRLGRAELSKGHMGIARSIDPLGFPETVGQEHHLLNTLRAVDYGGDPTRFHLWEFTPEEVQAILERRRELKPLQDAAKTEIAASSEYMSEGRRPVDPNKKTLLRAIADHGGLSKDLARTLWGEETVRGFPGLFTENGMQMDDMIIRLLEDRFNIDINRADDVGGYNQLTDMIHQARQGRKIRPAGFVESERTIRSAENAWAEQQIADSGSPTTGNEGGTTVDPTATNEGDGRQVASTTGNEGTAGDAAQWENEWNTAADAGDLDRLLELSVEKPAALTERHTGETWDDYINRTIDETALNEEQRLMNNKVQEAKDRSTQTERAAQNTADAAMSRQLFMEKLRDEMKLPQDQLEAYMEMSNAVAAWYSKATGESAEAFYARYYEDIRREAVEADLYQDYGYGRIETSGKMNRTEGMADYARMLVRAGATELKFALRNEPTLVDRRALLSEVHKINPVMAEQVARQSMDVLFQQVWHGSPHKFDKFTLSKIGTGEGAQFYGWGLYFAGDKGIAKWYHEKLSGPAKPQRMTVDGQDIPSSWGEDIRNRLIDQTYTTGDTLAQELLKVDIGVDPNEIRELITDGAVKDLEGAAFEAGPAAVKAFDEWKAAHDAIAEHSLKQQGFLELWSQIAAWNADKMTGDQILTRVRSDMEGIAAGLEKRLEEVEDPGTRRYHERRIRDLKSALQFMDEHKLDVKPKETPGQLFRVDIPDDGYLDWDKKLSEQPEMKKLLPKKEKRAPFTKKMKDELAHVSDIINEKTRTPAGVELDTIYSEMNAKYNQWSFADWTPEEKARYDDATRRYEAETDAAYARFKELSQTPGAPLAWSESADLRSDNSNYKAQSAFDDYEIRVSRNGKYYELHSGKGKSVVTTSLTEIGRDVLMKRAQQQDSTLLRNSASIDNQTGAEYYKARTAEQAAIVKQEHPEFNENQITFEAQRRASLDLKELGFQGIRYLDGNSRSQGLGSHNFVVFDNEAIKVLETYFQDQQKGFAKGGVTFDADGIKATIHAFELADFSTVVHENAHVYRRVLADVAMRTGNPQIATDLRTIEEWAGVKDGVWDRAAEEQFARGFERYITEGAAPTPRLAQAFARMRQWMLSIYKVISGRSIDVKITPEVKAVFDRMLSEEPTQIATPGEHIDMAERMRNGSDRRLPAHQQLRSIWDALEGPQRSEVMSWLLKSTLVDPLSGLETLVAKELEGEKPAGWIEATSDLNALTAINNNFGHTAGDEIITAIGKIAKEEVAKETGRAFRVGGDEFTYWFPDKATADRVLAAIDERVSSEVFMVGGQKRTGFSISYGIGETHELADQALYADKTRRIETGQRPKTRDTIPSTLRTLSDDIAVASQQLTDTPAFQKWFGNSKIVDADGQPLKVYHGTTADFRSFKPNDKSHGTKAIYFASDPGAAESYAALGYFDLEDTELPATGATIVPVYLRMENPYIMSKAEAAAGANETAKIIAQAKKDGYDGVIMRGARDDQGLRFTKKGIKQIKPGQLEQHGALKTDVYVVFKGTQVKSPFNEGAFNPRSRSILRQAQMEPVWYMKTEQIVEGINQPTMTVDQLRGMLTKGGAKADELKWLGLDELLEKRKGKITKQEVLDHIQANKVEIKEVTKGGGEVTESEVAFDTWEVLEKNTTYNQVLEDLADMDIIVDSDTDQPSVQIFKSLNTDEEIPIHELPVEAQALARQARDIYDETFKRQMTGKRLTTSPTTYNKYKMPGGENYREILFTLPKKPITELPGDALVRQNGSAGQADEWSVYHQNETIGIGKTEEAAIQDALGTLNEHYNTNQPFYQSSHWREPNVLAHTRLTDRIDADGKRILFVEEVQSDWHQAGREQGYRDDAKFKEADDLHRKLTGEQMVLETKMRMLRKDIADDTAAWHATPEYKAADSTIILRGADGSELYRGSDKKEAFNIRRDNFDATEEFEPNPPPEALVQKQLEWLQMNKQWEELKARIKQALTDRQAMQGGVAPAPFAKTWHEMVMKRILRMAAEDGYDRVAWTTGEQQSSRYELSNYVDRIVTQKNYTNDTYNIDGFESDHTVLNQRDVPEARLHEYVGRDLAKKVIEAHNAEPKWEVEYDDPNSDTETITETFDTKEEAQTRRKELRDADVNSVSINRQNTGTQAWDGIDLQVGGEGMKGFYDKMLVDWANKYAKKWGATVGETEINMQQKQAFFKSLAEAQDFVDENPGKPYTLSREDRNGGWSVRDENGSVVKTITTGDQVHAIDVTPEMKKSVMEGQPLFQKAEQDWTSRIDDARTSYENKTSRPEWIDAAIKTFGIAKTRGDACFVLPDGRVINVGQDHGNISQAIGKQGRYVTDEFMNSTGSLRYWESDHEVYVSMDNTVPNQAQLKTVRDALKSHPDALLSVDVFSEGKLLTGNTYNAGNMASNLNKGVAVAKQIFESNESASNIKRIDQTGDMLFQTVDQERQLSWLDMIQEAPPVTTTAFERWFKQSKVVDDSGKPRVMYHGTGSAGFDTFLKEKIAAADKNLYGPGFYFTADQDVASSYTSKNMGLGGTDIRLKTDYLSFSEISGIKRAIEDRIELAKQEQYNAPADQLTKAVSRRSDLEWMLRDFDDAATMRGNDIGGAPAEIITDLADNPTLQELWRDVISDVGIEEAQIGPAVYPVYLSIEKPFDMDKQFTGPEAAAIIRRYDKLLAGIWEEAGVEWTGKDLYERLRIHTGGSKADANQALKALGFDGITHEGGHIVGDKPHRVFIAFEPEQIKSINNRGTYDPHDPNMLRQENEAPLGTVDNASGFKADSEWLQEGWTKKVQPLLDAMTKTAVERLKDKPLDGAMKDVSAEGQKMLRDYINRVKSDMGAVKNSTMKWGASQRDFAMLNYNRRYGFDRGLEAIVPYEFYPTRSLMTWGARALDKPSWFANYARIRNMQNKHERDIPERLRNKFKINAPWLPDWMGDALYIDPLGYLFTPANYIRPFEQMRKDKNMQVIEAERILQEWSADGTHSDQEIAEAARTRTGTLWERAAAEAATRRESEIANPFDFFSTMLGPAWYLSTPLNLLGVEVPGISKGKPEKVTNLPLTNTARAFETVTKDSWAEPIGKIIGLAGKPESWLRKQAGLPEFGEYGDYYIDRQLANMVADGLISSQEAQTAMIERTGPNFDQARERVKMELAMKTPGAGSVYALTHEGAVAGAQAFVPSLFGAGLLPSGELEYRGLKSEWNAAWKKADAGDKTAINAFFEAHPEYEAYLAKGKKPDERLRSFMIGNIWDAYMSLGDTNKKQANAQMGEEFQTSFLNKETRSYETIPVETLTEWAQMLQTMVPRTEKTAPMIDRPADLKPTLNLYDPRVTQITDSFFQTRKEKFGDYYMLEQGYYSLPKSERVKYLLQFPRLKEYWDWKKQVYDRNPDLVPIMQGKTAKQIDTSTWAPGLEEYVVLYAMTGMKLPKGARMALEQQWIREGQPMGDLQVWLDSQVVPAMMYQQSSPTQ